MVFTGHFQSKNKLPLGHKGNNDYFGDSFYVLTYKSFKNLLGWPSSESLPDRFRLVAAQIYEPNALINSEGAIFLVGYRYE